jgi:signal transduction histidine kinase
VTFVLTARRPDAKPLTVGRFLTAAVSPRTWAATGHVLLDFPIGLAAFVFVVVGVSVTIAMAFTVVLFIPAVAILFFGLRLMGMFERARLSSMLGVRIADPYPVFEGSLWNRIKARVFSAGPWKEMAYAVVLFPLAVVGFSLVVTAWCGSIGLVLLPAYVHALPGQIAHFWLFDVTPGASAWVAGAFGVVTLLFVAPWIARSWAALDSIIGAVLLGRDQSEEIDVLEERVDSLEESRSWAIEIAEAERRRIERDLHDGAQQRLVALAMDLGRAKEKMDTDPDGAKELVEQAHNEAKRAIVELRDLARGIHPVSLGDRGLPGAIPALAGRSAIPVDVHVSVPERPAPAIEGIAYFVVSESLANAVKYSSAKRVSVRLVQHADRLFLDIVDDGVGGADPALGSGLRGLAERVASVDGRFDVSSPIGGPTEIRVELPCAS